MSPNNEPIKFPTVGASDASPTTIDQESAAPNRNTAGDEVISTVALVADLTAAYRGKLKPGEIIKTLEIMLNYNLGLRSLAIQARNFGPLPSVAEPTDENEDDTNGNS